MKDFKDYLSQVFDTSMIPKDSEVKYTVFDSYNELEKSVTNRLNKQSLDQMFFRLVGMEYITNLGTISTNAKDIVVLFINHIHSSEKYVFEFWGCFA